MKTRIVHTKIWQDDFVESLTVTQKLLFLYYLTNESVNLLHLYECSDRRVAFETGVAIADIQKAKEVFMHSGKIYFFKSYVYLKNADKYEDYTSDVHKKAKSTLLNTYSQETIEWYEGIKTGVYTSPTPVIDQSDTGPRPDINNKTEIINHKPKERKEVKEEKKEEKTDRSTLSAEEQIVYDCFLSLGYKDNGSFKAFMEEIVVDLPRVALGQNAKAWRDWFEGKVVKNHKSSFRNWLSKPYATQKVVSQHIPPSIANERVPSPEEVMQSRKKIADVWRKAAEKNPFLKKYDEV